MSNGIKLVMGLALVTVVSACGKNESEEVVFTAPAPAPIMAEPTYSKY